MATSKVNTSRFLAKGGTNAVSRVGSVEASPVSQGTVPAGGFLGKGGNKTNSTPGVRMAGLSNNAKVSSY